MVKVVERLLVSVPEFIATPEAHTNVYMLPAHSSTQIQTSRKSKLNIFQSQERVLAPSEEDGLPQQVMRTTQEAMVELGQDNMISTLGRYGQVTLILQEDQNYGNQQVMLNLLIADIFSLSIETFNEAVSLPVDSQTTLPIKFLNAQGQLFSRNIQRLGVQVQLSHPQVLSAELDQFNQSLTLTPRAKGDCLVKVFLSKQPSVFDSFKVRVASVIEPNSPVALHLGSSVEFKVDPNELDSKQLNQLSAQALTWTSSNSRIVEISQVEGVATALEPGKAQVQVHMSGLDAVAQVEVGPVTEGRIVEHQPLVLNIDHKNEELSVAIDFYLRNSDFPIKNEQVLPLTGASINQNVGIDCSPQAPHLFSSRGVPNEVGPGGFQCQLAFSGPDRINEQSNIPKVIDVAVFALGFVPKHKSELSYRKEVLHFKVQVVSEIKLPHALASPSAVLKLDSSKRSQ
jgi:hypothetical protein